jgi:hypothetical protein
MTFDDRVQAVAAEKFGRPRQGFSPRDAQFLTLVLLHAGVCMKRQYLMLHGTAYGQVVQDFFRRLVTDGLATAYAAMHGKARVYHVHHRRLYAAIGEPHSRLRRPVAVGRAMERLMVLDAVLEHPNATWLATEDEKLAHFTQRLGTGLPRDWLPHVTFGAGPALVRRFFAERLPIAIEDDGRLYTFVYLVTRPSAVDLRAFLHDYAELLRGLPGWRLRVLLPPHLHGAEHACRVACHQELATPLRPAMVEEVQWYFEQRLACLRDGTRPIGADAVRYQRAARAFASPRYVALYRAWRRHGIRILHAASSPTLADALERRVGRIECGVLAQPYLHLSNLVGTA